MLDSVPSFAERVLVVGDIRANAPRIQNLDTVAAIDGLPGQAVYDCVVLADAPWNGATLSACRRLLTDVGRLLFVPPHTLEQDAIVDALKTAGFYVYTWNASPGSCAAAVKIGYDPGAHAMALRAQGRPALCYDVLCSIPFEFREDPELFVLIETEKHFALLEADAAEHGARRLERFWQTQMCFFDIIHVLPDEDVAYQCQAEMWGRLRDFDMAGRLLRSIQAVKPTPAVAELLQGIPAETNGRPGTVCDSDVQVSLRPLRVLFFMNGQQPDFGLDTLYDGLCRVLGPENVVEYPFKASLHGKREGTDASKWERYPCLFDWPGMEASAGEIAARAREGAFDCVLFGDLGFDTPRDTVEQILGNCPGIPIFIVDQQDNPIGNTAKVETFLGGRTAAACFKREMLRTVDYGPRCFPMPFACPDGLVATDLPEAYARDLFWAGHRRYGMRRLYVDHIEKRFGMHLDVGVAPEHYAQAVQESLLGLSLFGVGFDTIRYWEIPANGCTLFAERPPIRIPNNFVDGQSAIFFGDVPEMDEKLAYYLAHPEETHQIGRAGYEHLKRFHTGTCRARQLLREVARVLS